MGLNKIERKILFFNKLKAGMSKEEAYNAVAKDIEVLKKTAKNVNKKKSIKENFKENFKELTKK